MSVVERREDPAVATIREALGAIAVAQPAIYWLHADSTDDWWVRRAGDADGLRFASKERALAHVRLAVVRCASYRLYLLDGENRITQLMP